MRSLRSWMLFIKIFKNCASMLVTKVDPCALPDPLRQNLSWRGLGMYMLSQCPYSRTACIDLALTNLLTSLIKPLLLSLLHTLSPLGITSTLKSFGEEIEAWKD